MKKRTFVAALTGAALVLITSFEPQSAAAQEAGADTALEEIIVTARKRDESLREIPESVSAISSFELEQGHISHINDIGLEGHQPEPLGPRRR